MNDTLTGRDSKAVARTIRRLAVCMESRMYGKAMDDAPVQTFHLMRDVKLQDPDHWMVEVARKAHRAVDGELRLPDDWIYRDVWIALITIEDVYEDGLPVIELRQRVLEAATDTPISYECSPELWLAHHLDHRHRVNDVIAQYQDQGRKIGSIAELLNDAERDQRYQVVSRVLNALEDLSEAGWSDLPDTDPYEGDPAPEPIHPAVETVPVPAARGVAADKLGRELWDRLHRAHGQRGALKHAAEIVEACLETAVGALGKEWPEAEEELPLYLDVGAGGGISRYGFQVEPNDEGGVTVALAPHPEER